MEKLDFTGELSSQCIKEMEMHSKFDQKNLEAHYDALALNYDGVYKMAGYPDPEYVAKHTA